MTRPSFSFHRFWMATLALGLAGLAIAVVRDGDYYFAPLLAKACHPRHPMLRSSAGLGLALGVVGLSLMSLNLTYLLRRALVRHHRLGSLRSWMGFHVATGILGAACVLVHSGLWLRSAPATVAIFALSVVILSGLVGRYLYARVPRSLEGRLLELEELRSALSARLEQLRALGAPSEAMSRLLAPPPARPSTASLSASLVRFARDELL
ncbi:MAG: hypothetical protein AB1486_34465, partial [Planctomycetota bacterium]